MMKRQRLLLGVAAVLLVAVGVLLGQQTQRSKLDKYLQPTNVTSMQLALIESELDRLRANSYGLGVREPELSFDTKTRSIRAFTLVNDDLTKQPLEKVRLILIEKAFLTLSDVKYRIPEVTDADFVMTFRDFSTNALDAYAKGGKPRDLAEFVNGQLIFK